MLELFVCNVDELKDGDRRIVRQGRTEIGVYRHSGQYYAYRNQCVHQGGPACEGIVRSRVVELLSPEKTVIGQTYDESDPHIVCPWHGWEFKLKTGVCAPDPNLRLKSYEVTAREGGIYVVL
jgi:nitrite reductase/ring-hydroxylating ferredoxin subunit